MFTFYNVLNIDWLDINLRVKLRFKVGIYNK